MATRFAAAAATLQRASPARRISGSIYYSIGTKRSKIVAGKFVTGSLSTTRRLPRVSLSARTTPPLQASSTQPQTFVRTIYAGRLSPRKSTVAAVDLSNLARRFFSSTAGAGKSDAVARSSTLKTAATGAAAGGVKRSGAGAGAGAGAGGGEGQKKWSRIWLLAKLIKYTRIPALILGVYGLGYQQGIIDYSRDPKLKQDDLLTNILVGVGCTDRSRVKTAKDGDWRNKFLGPDDAQMRRVAIVGEKVIKAAKKYVDAEVGRVMQERMSHLTEKDKEDEDRLFRLLMKDEDCAFWAAAKQRMDGQWGYLLIDTEVANAFVSEILPQRVFVTTSMMNNFIENDDEMALVLGHEVSHLILGHVSDSNTLQTMLRTVEVLLLTLDPTEGILSLAFMSVLATVRHSLQAANSRENETQADELGIKLAAMACYDTRRAAQVFYKMHMHGTESGAEDAAAKESSRSMLSFIETHPPSLERHSYLLEASEEENADRYGDSHCASVRKMFKDMMKEMKRRESTKEGGNGESIQTAHTAAKESTVTPLS